MKHSEFYEAVEATFGSALGRSYVSDLYLSPLGATAREALAGGWIQTPCGRPCALKRGVMTRVGSTASILASVGAKRLR